MIWFHLAVAIIFIIIGSRLGGVASDSREGRDVSSLWPLVFTRRWLRTSLGRLSALS